MRIRRHPSLWASAPSITGDLWRGLKETGKPGHCLPERGARGAASHPSGGGVCLFLPRRALGEGKENQSEYLAP